VRSPARCSERIAASASGTSFPSHVTVSSMSNSTPSSAGTSASSASGRGTLRVAADDPGVATVDRLLEIPGAGLLAGERDLAFTSFSYVERGLR
jgi:hypothetical protein